MAFCQSNERHFSYQTNGIQKPNEWHPNFRVNGILFCVVKKLIWYAHPYFYAFIIHYRNVKIKTNCKLCELFFIQNGGCPVTSNEAAEHPPVFLFIPAHGQGAVEASQSAFIVPSLCLYDYKIIGSVFVAQSNSKPTALI